MADLLLPEQCTTEAIKIRKKDLKFLGLTAISKDRQGFLFYAKINCHITLKNTLIFTGFSEKLSVSILPRKCMGQ